MRTAILCGLAAASFLGPQAVAADGGVEVSMIRNRGWVMSVSGSTIDNPTPELKARLAQQVSVRFVDASIRDVVDFIHRATGVNMILTPDAEIAAAPVTLSVDEMRTDRVLRWITTLTDLRMSLVGEVVYLGTEPYRGRRTTVFYDVTDLVTPVRDFPGPDLALNTGDSRMPVDLFGVPEVDENSAFDPEELARIIEDHLSGR
jgi:hypothetical protein